MIGCEPTFVLLLQADRQPNRGISESNVEDEKANWISICRGASKFQSLVFAKYLRGIFLIACHPRMACLDLMQCISLAISPMPVDESSSHEVDLVYHFSAYR